MTDSRGTAAVHLFESGGEGGVFQHSLALAVLLSDKGHDVVLHTTNTPEIKDARVKYCSCVRWSEYGGPSRVVKRAARYTLRTIPHILAQEGILWIQGTFRTPLTLILIVLSAALRKTALFSPHNLFSRHGGKVDQGLLDLCVRNSPTVMVYNDVDYQALQRQGIRAMQSHLFAYAPVIPDETMTRWTALIAHHQVGVCSVGQIRSDKNLPMLTLAASKAGSSVAIMGQDTGGLTDVKAQLSLLGLGEDLLFPGYYPLEDMAALVSSCGLVALPYSVASQSGVAALAHAYGAKVIGHRVGGLGEQLDYEVESLDPEEWSKMLKRAVTDMANHQPERVPKPGRPEHVAQLLQSLRMLASQN